MTTASSPDGAPAKSGMCGIIIPGFRFTQSGYARSNHIELGFTCMVAPGRISPAKQPTEAASITKSARYALMPFCTDGEQTGLRNAKPSYGARSTPCQASFEPVGTIVKRLAVVLAIFELLVAARGAIIICNSDARRRRRSAAGRAGTVGHGTGRRRGKANSHEILRP